MPANDDDHLGLQFHVEDNPGNPNFEISASHPEAGEVGRISVSVRKSRRYPERGMEPAPPQVRGVHVHPDFQRQGIGSRLYNLATERAGSAPMHDASMSPEARSWADKVGGELHPRMQVGMSHDPEVLRKSFERRNA